MEIKFENAKNCSVSGNENNENNVQFGLLPGSQSFPIVSMLKRKEIFPSILSMDNSGNVQLGVDAGGLSRQYFTELSYEVIASDPRDVKLFTIDHNNFVKFNLDYLFRNKLNPKSYLFYFNVGDVVDILDKDEKKQSCVITNISEPLKINGKKLFDDFTIECEGHVFADTHRRNVQLNVNNSHLSMDRNKITSLHTAEEPVYFIKDCIFHNDYKIPNLKLHPKVLLLLMAGEMWWNDLLRNVFTTMNYKPEAKSLHVSDWVFASKNNPPIPIYSAKLSGLINEEDVDDADLEDELEYMVEFKDYVKVFPSAKLAEFLKMDIDTLILATLSDMHDENFENITIADKNMVLKKLEAMHDPNHDVDDDDYNPNTMEEWEMMFFIMLCVPEAKKNFQNAIANNPDFESLEFMDKHKRDDVEILIQCGEQMARVMQFDKSVPLVDIDKDVDYHKFYVQLKEICILLVKYYFPDAIDLIDAKKLYPNFIDFYKPKNFVPLVELYMEIMMHFFWKSKPNFTDILRKSVTMMFKGWTEIEWINNSIQIMYDYVKLFDNSDASMIDNNDIVMTDINQNNYPLTLAQRLGKAKIEDGKCKTTCDKLKNPGQKTICLTKCKTTNLKNIANAHRESKYNITQNRLSSSFFF